MHPENCVRRRLASHPLPDSWSPDQALAVADFCDRICSIIWDAYGEEMLARLHDIAKKNIRQDRLRQLFLPLDDTEFPF